MNHNTVINIGAQKFDTLRERNSFYIDKTGFIREWWEYGSDITLITRPRRFGKTLNMSTVECFFSNQYAGRSDLFEGLSIWEEEKYRKLQGTYPVLFLSFASVKTGEIDEIKKYVKHIITNIYSEYRDIMQSDVFNDNDRKAFASVNVKMDDVTAYTAINTLCIYLKKYYGKDVIILLDEYDTPMQESWLAGSWDMAVSFFRKFFNSTFKTNKHILRGIITGITRISKESIFSDLNNLKVVTTTSEKYAAYFGFTEEETFHALDELGLGDEKQGVKKWYNGFTFGTHTDIYNPWSIASFIESGGKYETYWADTSSNGLVNSLIQKGNAAIKETMEELIQGKSFAARIDEQIVFDQLDNTNAVWSLLLATGYLKTAELKYIGERKEKQYTLALTNLEVNIMFENMVKTWFGGNTEMVYNNFIRALLIDDVESMNEFMNDIALHTFSNFDIAKSASSQDAPERFYHGFVLGLMVELTGRFKITSNRESGFGRYDIMLTPVDREHDRAYIIEFKVHKHTKEKNLEETLANAHAQIEEKRYESALIQDGFAPEQIRKYGFAFRGKECLIG